MEQTKKKEWLRGRGYPHVTNKLGEQDLSILEKNVENPNWVARHAFFPLLKRAQIVRRYKKKGYSDKGESIREHFNHEKNESNAKIRPIEYATHIDTVIFSYYAKEKLLPIYEQKLLDIEGLTDCITAYRRIPVELGSESNKSNIHFAAEVFEYIKQKGDCVALAFDIESFFPSLDHKILKKAWANLLGNVALEADHFNVFKASTRYSYIDIDEFRVQKPIKFRRKAGFDEQKLDKLRRQFNIHSFFESAKEMREAIKNGEISLRVNNEKKGIPHGLPISSVLANLYLLDFDTKVFEEIAKPFNAFYRRYSDDIIIVCDTKDYLFIKSFVESTVKQYKLNISEPKTEVCFFTSKNGRLDVSREITTLSGQKRIKPNMPLVYLGFEFYGHKTLIKSANLAKFYRRMKKAVKTNIKHKLKSATKQGKEDSILFTRKLRRIYTHHGANARKWFIHKTVYQFDLIENVYKPQKSELPTNKKYLGNTLSYAYRAAKIMNEPSIRRQFRRHHLIFKKTLDKYLDPQNTEGC